MLSNIWNHPKTSAAGLLIMIVTIGGVFVQQGVTLGNVGASNVVALICGVATALLGLLSRDPAPTATQTGSTAKLGAWMLIALMLSAGFTTGCSGVTVAQDIVNWTPTITSTATTVAQVVASLDPIDKPIILAAVVGFDAAANLVSNQAKTYLANPGATTLAQLQAQVLGFQQNVNAAVLEAARIVDPASQQRVLMAIQALATGLTAVLALISTIKGNTLSQSVIAPVKVSQVEPLFNRQEQLQQIAAHYGESRVQAEFQLASAERQMAAVGL